MNLTCPTNGKDYIMPTKHWLKPLQEIISTDIATLQSKLILSEIINDKIGKQEILVKLTSGRNHMIREFTSKIKGMPNLVNTYCVLLCNDDFLLVDKEKQFCNLENIDDKNKIKLLGSLPKKSKNYNYSVTLELMEFYKKGSIASIKNISLKDFSVIFFQLVFCQLNLFAHCGYTHNDIHDGNILIKKHPKNVILDYEYITSDCIETNKEYKLNVSREYILSDYDKMYSFEYKYFIHEFEYLIKLGYDVEDIEFIKYSLYSNILSTINLLKSKMNKEDKIRIENILLNIQTKYEDKIISNIRTFIVEYYESRNFNQFKKKIKLDVCMFLKKFLKKFNK